MRSSNAFEIVHGGAAIGFLAATVKGWTVQDWAAVAALFYTLMLIAAKAWSWWRALRAPAALPPPAP